MKSFELTVFDENYTLYDKLSDPNKDSNEKGTQERFAEVWAAEIDSTVPYIENLNANVLVPKTRLSRFVAYYEQEMGYKDTWLWFKDASIGFRNNVVKIMQRIYQIRTTQRAYDIMFSWLGITMVLTEDFNYDAGFDSTTTFDSSLRTFDSYYNVVIPYDVALTGPVISFPIPLPFSLSNNAVLMLRAIYTILLFNQPETAILRSITYNGADISAEIKNIVTPNYLRTSF